MALFFRNISIFLFLFAFTLFIQVRVIKSFASEFGAHSDEPAHYVTGVMVHDFLLSNPPPAPMAFANIFYEHYPKVALGNWPPVFYLVQGLWTLFFGISRYSFLVLMAVISTSVSILVFFRLRDFTGNFLAICGSLLWSSLPIIMTFSGMIMNEILITLFCLLAVMAYSRYLAGYKKSDAFLFGVFASLAILTKGSAISLALVPVLAILLTKKCFLVKKFSFWLPALVVLMLAGPWSYFFKDVAREGWLANTPNAAFFFTAIRYYSSNILAVSGIGVGMIFITGAFIAMFSIRSFPIYFKISLAFIISVIIVHCIIPCGYESRHLIPATPHVIIVGLSGLAYGFNRLLPLQLRSFRTQIIFVLIVASMQIPAWRNLRSKNNYGFGAIADNIFRQSDKKPVKVLISSDPTGEGMFIAEMVLRDKRPFHLVRRASKYLSTSLWNGLNYKLTYTSEQEIADYLARDSIRFIVLDKTISPRLQTPDMDLLSLTLSNNTEKFRPVDEYIRVSSGRYLSGVQLYEQQW